MSWDHKLLDLEIPRFCGVGSEFPKSERIPQRRGFHYIGGLGGPSPEAHFIITLLAPHSQTQKGYG